MKEEKIIMYDSSEAAFIKEGISGWVSGNGHFWGNNEDAARYDGCTHKKCECGKAMSKGWMLCEDCRRKKDHQRYMDYPYKEWDGKEPVYFPGGDKYYFNEEDLAEDLCNDHDPEDGDTFLLLICNPNYAYPISSDTWSGELPEDGEIPDELANKIDEFNKFLKTLPPLSWSPGKIRTSYSYKAD